VVPAVVLAPPAPVVVLLFAPVVGPPALVVFWPPVVEGPAPPVVVGPAPPLVVGPAPPLVVVVGVPLVPVVVLFEVGPALVDLSSLAGSLLQASVTVPVKTAVTNQVAAKPTSFNKKVRMPLTATIVLLRKDAETKPFISGFSSHTRITSGAPRSETNRTSASDIPNEH